METVHLERGGSFSGTLELTQGGRLVGSTLRFDRVESDAPGAAVLATETTGTRPDGTYSIGGLEAGTYRVTASYMIEPTDLGNFELKHLTHELGTVVLGVDEEQTLNGVLPFE